MTEEVSRSGCWFQNDFLWCGEHWVLYVTAELLNTVSKTNDVLSYVLAMWI